MFGRKSNEIAALRGTVAGLEAAVEERDQRLMVLAPLADVALEIHDTAATLLDGLLGNPNLDVIAEATRLVRERRTAEVRASVVSEYERRHRDEMLEQLRAGIEQDEGAAIDARVRKELMSDTEAMERLKASARKEIVAKYKAQAKATLMANDQAHIEQEAHRQVLLDTYDLQFRRTGAFDMHDPDLLSILLPGDSLALALSDPDYEDNDVATMTFTWASNNNGLHGWIYGGIDDESVSFDLQEKVPKNRFVLVGCMNPDFTTADVAFSEQLLRAHTPAVLAHGDNIPIPIKTREDTSGGYYGSSYDYDKALLQSINFAVRPYQPAT